MSYINIQDIQGKERSLIFYFTLLEFHRRLKQTLSPACFTHFYRQLLARHVNPGGWNFSLFICPLSAYMFFSLLYVTYLCRTLPFSRSCTADSMPACSHSSSTFTSLPQAIPSLPAASPFSLCHTGSPCLFSVTAVLIVIPWPAPFSQSFYMTG